MGRRGLYPQILNGVKSQSPRTFVFHYLSFAPNSETLARDGRPHLLPLEQNCSATGGPSKIKTVVGSQPKAHCFLYISEVFYLWGTVFDLNFTGEKRHFKCCLESVPGKSKDATGESGQVW